MKSKVTNIPVFKSESEEANWWASQAGRSFVKQKSIEAVSKGKTLRGSPLVQRLNKTASVQIALRLPESDLAEARRIWSVKPGGYDDCGRLEGFSDNMNRGRPRLEWCSSVSLSE